MSPRDSNQDFFWNTSKSQGAGVHWAWCGIQVPEALPKCGLCCHDECVQAELFTYYSDCTWFLSLGTITRYKGAEKVPQNRRNVIAFVGDTVVLHTGATEGDKQTFLVFDRMHVHKVLVEFQRGNSLHLSKYALHSSASKSSFCFPHRAMWSKAPQNSCSRLFHRWLLLDNPSLQSKYSCVEHDNDIPLDCRAVNLKRGKTNRANNLHIHRLKYAYWEAGAKAVTKEADRINETQRKYWNIVHACPPLPDLVFTRKRKRQGNVKTNPRQFSVPSQKRRREKVIIDLT